MDGTHQLISFYEDLYRVGSIRTSVHRGDGWGGTYHYNFNNLASRLSTEESNIFLSLLKVGFSATQAQIFFDKLPKLTYSL